MSGSPTPILGLIVPTIGGDTNVWGTELNTDLALIDNIGAVGLFARSANFAPQPQGYLETLWRVTTGTSTIVVTLPAAATYPGRIITIKKVDAAVGQVSIVGSIDGQAAWDIATQYSYCRLVSNGVTYDVIGNN